MAIVGVLAAAGLDPMRRPETLQLVEFSALADAWEAAAWENRIYPLDEGTSIKYLLRPPRSAIYTEAAAA